MKFIRKMISTIVSILLLSGTLHVNAHAYSDNNSIEDMRLIKSRLREYYLDLDTIDDGAKVETVLVSEAKSHLDLANEDGSFDDVDYKATDNAANGRPWSPYLALDRMQAIAIAYSKEGHELYKDADALEFVNNSLRYWKQENPYSSNWWENDIGVNLRFSRIGLFLEHDLDEDALDIIINNLNEEGKYQGTGQNNLWYDQNAIYRALIKEDAPKLKQIIDDALSYILVLQTDNVTKEALQVDNSLYFHGEQFYSNGYGLSMYRDMSFWLLILKDTEFALSDDIVSKMSDYMLEGTSWTIRGDIMELYLGYRPYKLDIGLKNYAEEYLIPLKRMKEVDSANKDRYKKLIDNISGKVNDNGLNGNNYMWRVGYASHMRDDYGVNVKMDSKRIIGGEWRGSWKDVNHGNIIYWSSSASSTFVVDGDEYTSIFPTFDWKHTPGATTPYRNYGGYQNYGRINNNSDHTIGVSNGRYGSTSYIMDKVNTKANKSYFFFDDEIVALGSNINATDGDEIHTTINQTKVSKPIMDGTIVGTETSELKTNASWAHNNKIGYVFPNEGNVNVANKQQMEMPSLWEDEQKENLPNTFSLWFNHGVKPKDDSYSYIVLPNKSVEETENYANNSKVEIVENSNNIHAVSHEDLNLTMVNFYKEGELEYAPGKFIKSDQAVNIIIDENKEAPVISLAMTDTDYGMTANVDLVIDGNVYKTEFVSKVAPYTGQTIELEAGHTNKYLVSSEQKGFEIKYAFDKDLNTSWKSDDEEEQFVQTNLETAEFVTNIEIHWGETFAKDLDVLVSMNGLDFFKIDKSRIVGNRININEVISAFRIELKESSGIGYEIKEIDVNSGTNIAHNKRVEVSSVSATDKGNVPEFATDGNMGTRWSSKRDSDNEWIIVDLGGEAITNAIRIHWEGARSSKYELQFSDDKVNWTVAKEVEDNGSLLDVTVFDTEQSGRYLKVNSTKSKLPRYGISIFEIEVFGNVELAAQNIALFKPSEASSEYKNQYTGFVLESKYAFDGSLENRGDSFQSRWVSERNSDDEWILVDLEEHYNVENIVLNWEGAYGKEYEVLISNDKVNWEQVFYTYQGRAGLIDIPLDEKPVARYVKMQGHKPGTKYGYSIWEFEVYGKETLYKGNLEAVINEFEALDETLYTKDSFEVLKASILEARSIYEKSENQIEIDNITNVVKTFIEELVELDYSGLIKVIEEAKLIDKDKYTSESVNNLASKLDNANIILSSLNQNEIDEATLKLREAIDNLVEPDYSELQEIIEHVETLDTLIYTNESVINLLDALELSKLALESKSQSEINNANNYLRLVLDSLVEVDKTNLEILFEKASKLDKSRYTRTSYNEFMQVLTEAQKIKDSQDQDEIDSWVEKLSFTFVSLEYLEKAELETVLEKAKSFNSNDYTSSSYEALRLSINNAKDALNDTDQDKIDEAVIDLESKISSLVKINKKKLCNSIEKAKKIDLSKYTKSSVAQFRTVLNNSVEIMNNSQNQNEINDIIVKLEMAISKLTLVDDTSNDVIENVAPEINENSNTENNNVNNQVNNETVETDDYIINNDEELEDIAEDEEKVEEAVDTEIDEDLEKDNDTETNIEVMKKSNGLKVLIPGLAILSFAILVLLKKRSS